MENVAISIVCNTYNHEKYIRSALEGFVMQETNFVYEVLIHDDASTDGTVDIIREFENKYPDLIKPVYQVENQYSKGAQIGIEYQYPRAKGKYIALCEGDDYWIDSLKLQKQYDAMEAHKEVDVCAHGVNICCNGEIKGKMAPVSYNTIFTPEDVIISGGGFVSTNSLMFRKEIFLNITEYRKILSIDYTIQIQGSLRGGMLYLADCMGVYRTFTEDSWTSRMRRDSFARSNHLKKVKEMLNSLNVETNYAYDLAIKFHILEIEKQYEKLLDRKYKDILHKLPLKRRMAIYIKYVKSIIKVI